MDKATNIIFFSRFRIYAATIRIVLFVLFFCSGSSAVIYQVMWQRMLYTVFGLDLESITMIVSVFMFGLGIGGLYGGYLADQMPYRLLYLYVMIELAIAVFGFMSPKLITTLDHLLVSNSKLLTAVLSFILLAIPTMLMGATFPILVTHTNIFYRHVGRSVGNLYFVNTLGGSVGAFLSGFVLLYCLDLPGSIYFAACLNLSIAGIAFVAFRRQA